MSTNILVALRLQLVVKLFFASTDHLIKNQGVSHVCFCFLNSYTLVLVNQVSALFHIFCLFSICFLSARATTHLSLGTISSLPSQSSNSSCGGSLLPTTSVCSVASTSVFFISFQNKSVLASRPSSLCDAPVHVSRTSHTPAKHILFTNPKF